jgi:hypothetical protein
MDTIKIPIIIKKRLSKSIDITLPHMLNENDIPTNMGSVTDNLSTNNSIIGNNQTQTQLTDISSQLSEKKKIKIIKKPVITTKKIKKIPQKLTEKKPKKPKVIKEKKIVELPKVNPADLPKDRWVVASFDIGIKNLAYCILSWDNTQSAGSQYTIYDWNVINLIPDEKQLYCESINKGGANHNKVCGKKASYYYISSDIDNKNTNIGLCAKHSTGYSDQSALMRHKKVDNVSNLELNIELIKELDKISLFMDCDEILLEHQPSKNPKMKNLSYMIFSYFVTRGIVDKKDGRLNQVKFINPKRKLSIYEGPVIECKLKNSYSQNKFYGKEYCRYEINNKGNLLEYFNNFAKKDDLADSMLQGAWYLKKNNKTIKKKIIKPIKNN